MECWRSWIDGAVSISYKGSIPDTVLLLTCSKAFKYDVCFHLRRRVIPVLETLMVWNGRACAVCSCTNRAEFITYAHKRILQVALPIIIPTPDLAL